MCVMFKGFVNLFWEYVHFRIYSMEYFPRMKFKLISETIMNISETNLHTHSTTQL